MAERIQCSANTIGEPGRLSVNESWMKRWQSNVGGRNKVRWVAGGENKKKKKKRRERVAGRTFLELNDLDHRRSPRLSSRSKYRTILNSLLLKRETHWYLNELVYSFLELFIYLGTALPKYIVEFWYYILVWVFYFCSSKQKYTWWFKEITQVARRGTKINNDSFILSLNCFKEIL